MNYEGVDFVCARPPPLSKVRLGEKKSAVRTEGGCLRQNRVSHTNSPINPKKWCKKCGPNGGCALDKEVTWTRGEGVCLNSVPFRPLLCQSCSPPPHRAP